VLYHQKRPGRLQRPADFLEADILVRPLEADQCAVLEKSGIQVGNKDRQVFTGTLSASEISELSDQSWVLNIKLSENLRLLRSSRVGHGLKVPGL
jgi:hypothetical protein